MPLRGIPSLALLATLSGFTLRLKPRKTAKIAIRFQAGQKWRGSRVVTNIHPKREVDIIILPCFTS
jgi:hypothetical protein